MVGDRERDVLGAKAVGLPCMGVLWGYGSREELTNAGASALAETPAEMAELILEM
jgi:phosphoglycolate phosphatase